MTPTTRGSRPGGQNPLPLWVIDVINYNPQSADLNTQGEKIMSQTATLVKPEELLIFNGVVYSVPQGMSRFEFAKELREGSR